MELKRKYAISGWLVLILTTLPLTDKRIADVHKLYE